MEIDTSLASRLCRGIRHCSMNSMRCTTTSDMSFPILLDREACTSRSDRAESLLPRDTVVVASDGLFDNLHLDEVIEHGRSGKPIDRMNGLAEPGRLANDRVRTLPCLASPTT